MKASAILALGLALTACGLDSTAKNYMPDSMAGISLLLAPDENYSAWTDKGAYYMNDLGATKCSDMDWYSADAYRMAAYVNQAYQR